MKKEDKKGIQYFNFIFEKVLIGFVWANKIKNIINKMSLDKSGSHNTIALDLSSHNLNNSSSKQKFSFPKAGRFSYNKSLYSYNWRRCDSFYEMPSTKTGRSTSFGYGQKDMGIKNDRYAPEPATYNIES